MTDTRIGAPPAAGSAGLLAFLRDALARLRDRRLVLPALLLAVLVCVTTSVILLFPPVGRQIPLPAAAAMLLRVLGLVFVAVSILRILGGSERPIWRIDASFWLYAATVLAGLILTAAATFAVGGVDTLSDVLVGLIVMAVSAPFAAWFAAIAIERPLAWRPAPWLRSWGRWLPALLIWSVLFLLPLGSIHHLLTVTLIEGAAGVWFWPLVVVDTLVSVVLAVFGLALASTAYRSVARG
jgi:hypothetical protein